MKPVFDWLAAHKGPIGGGLLAAFLYLQANPLSSSKWYSLGVGLISTFLIGAGYVKSDSFRKPQ